MRIKIFLKKLIAISVAVLWAATLVGCFDLGDFSDESAYYTSFGDVRMVYQNPKSLEKDMEYEDYSIKDYFYNKNTGENFTYGDPKDEESDEGKDFPQLEYVYMAIPIEKNMSIESLSLYLKATKSCELEVFFYLVDEMPDDGDFTRVKLWGEPEFQQKFDENGRPILDGSGNFVYEKLVYSDPDESQKVAETSVFATQNQWVSLTASHWTVGQLLTVKESQYLLIRFANNCGVGKTENSPVSFRATNLLIRAFF